MDMRIPPLRIKIMLESNTLKSIMLVRRLAVAVCLFASELRHSVGGSVATGRRRRIRAALEAMLEPKRC